MSALGDYVHLNPRNYNRYSISQKTWQNPDPPALDSFIKSRINSIPTVKESEINELKLRLQKNSIPNELRDEKNIDKKWEEGMTVLWELIAAQSNPNAMGASFGQATRTTKKNGEDTAYRGAGNFIHTTDYDGPEYQKNKKIAQKAEKKMKIIDELINKMNSQGYLSKVEIRRLIKNFREVTYLKNDDFYNNNNINSVLGYINDVWANYSLLSVYQQVNGKWGEGLALLADDAISTMEIEQIREFLAEGLMKGDMKSIIKMDAAQLSKGLVSSMNLVKDGNSYTVKTEVGKKTQNKIDVQIQVNGKKVNASVKNYLDTSKYNYHLQDVNLFYALMFLDNQEKFSTHWLNLQFTDTLYSEKDKVNKILEKEIAFEALVSGNPLKSISRTELADVFIGFDRSKGKVMVVSTKEILRSSDYSAISFSPKIQNIKLTNEKYEDNGKINFQLGYKRINNLLVQTHKRNIKVTLNPKRWLK